MDGFKQKSSQNFSILRKLKSKRSSLYKLFEVSKEATTKFFANLRRPARHSRRRKSITIDGLSRSAKWRKIWPAALGGWFQTGFFAKLFYSSQIKIKKKQSIQAFRTSKEATTKFCANLRKAGTEIKKKKMPLPLMA